MRHLGDELNECLFRPLMTVTTVSLTWSMRLCELSGFALDSEFWCHESHGETFCSADPQVEGRSVLWTWVYSDIVNVLIALQLGRLRSPSQFLFPQTLEGMLKDDGDMKPVGNESAGVVVAAGSAPEAQDILGKRVAVTGGSSCAQYTKTSLNNPMFAVLLEDVSSLGGASFIRATKREGHNAMTYNSALREWDIRDVMSELESLFVNSLEC